tara:strand:+ start:135 stop:434 length:300 start_codon:yes stop_codon:yes gene_type:complete
MEKQNKKYWYLKPNFRPFKALVDELKEYDSVDVGDLHKTWKATGTNGNRSRIFQFENKQWERVAKKTKSRSGKTSDWTVYFKCLETEEEIPWNESPFVR